MKAAIVTELGKAPLYADFTDPAAGDGEALIDVTAAPLSHVTRYRASGTHYSSAGSLPFVVGLDGVGRHSGGGDGGKRVYFILPRAPFGGMAERTVVPATHLVPLPDGIDDATAAAVAIPAMSSWAALTVRSTLTPGQTVLVNGATGISGRLAVQVAKRLGAGKIIATGRNSAMLDALSSLGADVAISLRDDAALDEAFTRHFSDGVDIVLDYLWGATAERLIAAAAKTSKNAKPVRFIQIGSSGGGTIALPATAIRSSGLELIGCGMGSIAFDRILASIAAVFKAAAAQALTIETRTLPLAKIEGNWAIETTASRTVFVPG